MSLNFAGISPHPPIIIPEIGEKEDLLKVTSTIVALKKMTTSFSNAEIDTLLVISPHGLIYPDRFNICGMKKLFGTFGSFNHPDIYLESQNDLDFVALLEKKANEAKVNSLVFNNDGEFYELDHGVMVPLHYFTKGQEFSFKVVPITYSNLDRASHYTFGQVLNDACMSYSGRVGIIASGDLSHQLFQNPQGKLFDSTLVKDLKENNVKEILYYDEDFPENAGECGYRSILILLGALDGLKVKPEVLSYEGPFGVGYLVLNYMLPEK